MVAGAPAGAEWHDVSADDHAYWRLLVEAWEQAAADGSDLMILEHDVVCRPDVLEQFDTCPEPWCVVGYSDCCHPEPWVDGLGVEHESCREAWANMLGCTRFRSELMAACPDAVSSIPENLRGWWNLCDHIAGNKIHGVTSEQNPLGIRTKFTHHWHGPEVVHITRGVDPDFWYGPGGRYAQ